MVPTCSWNLLSKSTIEFLLTWFLFTTVSLFRLSTTSSKFRSRREPSMSAVLSAKRWKTSLQIEVLKCSVTKVKKLSPFLRVLKRMAMVPLESLKTIMRLIKQKMKNPRKIWAQRLESLRRSLARDLRLPLLQRIPRKLSLLLNKRRKNRKISSWEKKRLRKLPKLTQMILNPLFLKKLKRRRSKTLPKLKRHSKNF